MFNFKYYLYENMLILSIYIKFFEKYFFKKIFILSLFFFLFNLKFDKIIKIYKINICVA